jgi:hypothetical protein
MRTHLFDPNTGRVYDSYNISGNKDTTPITYNSGTFIGAANYLGHTNDAMLAANYVKNSMGTGGQLPNYDEHNDLGGFNGIFIRWMVKFMNERGLHSSVSTLVAAKRERRVEHVRRRVGQSFVVEVVGSNARRNATHSAAGDRC